MCQTEIIERNVDAGNDEAVEQNRHVPPITHFVIIHLNGSRYVMRQKSMPKLSLLIWHGVVRVEHEQQTITEQTWQTEAYSKSVI